MGVLGSKEFSAFAMCEACGVKVMLTTVHMPNGMSSVRRKVEWDGTLHLCKFPVKVFTPEEIRALEDEKRRKGDL